MPDSEVPNSTEDLLTGKRNDFWRLWRRRTFLILALLLLLIPLYGTFEPLFESILEMMFLVVPIALLDRGGWGVGWIQIRTYVWGGIPIRTCVRASWCRCPSHSCSERRALTPARTLLKQLAQEAF